MRLVLPFAALAAALALSPLPAAADPPAHAARHGHHGRGEAARDHRHEVRAAQREFREARANRAHWRRYDWNRPDPRIGRYYPDYYYAAGTAYRPYRLSRADRIYRGRDGRYYCRRGDGTTGLVVGAVLGGALGSRLGRGDSRVLGTLLGGTAGALLGREIDRGRITCR